jgi:hypothetical protein
MAKLFFGGFMKILVWIFIVVFFIGGFTYPFLFWLCALFVIVGPCVAIPAAVALQGKQVPSSKSRTEIRQAVEASFAEQKLGRKWWPAKSGLGQINYRLQLSKTGWEPVVSIDLEDVGAGQITVHVWMSHYTMGGLNGGRGTPFWVWGSFRAMRKVSQVAQAVA